MDNADITELSEAAQTSEATPASDTRSPLDDATQATHGSSSLHAPRPDDAAIQSAFPEEASGESAKPPGAGHKRDVSDMSNISDFAYRPGESGFTGNPSNQDQSRPHAPDSNALTNVISNLSFESFQTTAVNSERESSESSNDGRRQSPNRETESLNELRRIVENAKPGVSVYINVKTERLPPGQGFDFEAYIQNTSSTWKQLIFKELRA